MENYGFGELLDTQYTWNYWTRNKEELLRNYWTRNKHESSGELLNRIIGHAINMNPQKQLKEKAQN